MKRIPKPFLIAATFTLCALTTSAFALKFTFKANSIEPQYFNCTLSNATNIRASVRFVTRDLEAQGLCHAKVLSAEDVKKYYYIITKTRKNPFIDITPRSNEQITCVSGQGENRQPLPQKHCPPSGHYFVRP